MIAAAPLVLSGTLAVDSNQTSSIDNADGSSTTSTPLAGSLGSLGRVTGVWNESVDSFGEPSGLNVLRLQTGKGSLVITFSTVNTVKAHPAGHGEVYYAQCAEAPCRHWRLCRSQGKRNARIDDQLRPERNRQRHVQEHEFVTSGSVCFRQIRANCPLSPLRGLALDREAPV